MKQRNENRPGYKKTKVGWIPKEWECIHLSECIKIAQGQVNPKEKPYSQYFHIGPENILSGTGQICGLQTARDLGLRSGKYLFDDKSIVYSKIRPNLNKVCCPTFTGICSADAYPIWPESLLTKEYLFFYMLSEHFVKKATACSGRTGLPKINREDLLRLHISLPPLPEQERIAEVLSAWDKAIALTDRLIDAKQRLKKGLMQQLLTGRMRFSGMTGKWQETTLSEMGETYSGLNGKSKDDFGYGKPFVPYLNVFANEAVNMSDFCYVNIDSHENQMKVKYGDILFTGSSETPNEVGISSVVTEETDELYLNSFCIGFRPIDKSKLLPTFAQYYMRGTDFRKQMAKAAQGATRFNLSRKTLLKSKVVYPDTKEQRLIAACLSYCSNEIQLLLQKRENLQKQKKGLMQKLLTGEVRVSCDRRK